MANGKTDAWYPMYPADYLKDTLDLTLEEDGFYTRALNQVYINKGRIPVEPERLQRLLRVNRVQFNRCKWILARYFYQDGKEYGSRRADIEIAKAQDRAEVARENGKKSGGRPRKNPAETQRVISGLPDGFDAGNPTPNPEKSSSQSHSDPPLSPPSGNSPPTEDRSGLFRAALPVLFKAFGIDQPSWRDEEAMHAAWLELRAKKATSTDLTQRIARYREIWPDLPCTPNAVLKHWHTCKPATKAQTIPVDDGTPDSLLEGEDD